MTGFLVLLFAGAAVAYQYELPYYQSYLYPQGQNFRSYDPYSYDDEYVPVYRRAQPYSRYWPGLAPAYNGYPQQAAYPSYRELDINAPYAQQQLLLQQQQQQQQQQQLAQQQLGQQESLLFRAANQPQVSQIEQIASQEKPVGGKALEGIQQSIATMNAIPQQGNMGLGQIAGRVLSGVQSGQGLMTVAPVQGFSQTKGVQTEGVIGRDLGQTSGNQAQFIMVAPLKDGQVVEIIDRQQRQLETPVKAEGLATFKEGQMIGMVDLQRRELETPAIAQMMAGPAPLKQEQMIGTVGRQFAEPATPMIMEQMKEGIVATQGRQLVETPATVQKEVIPTMAEGQTVGGMIREKRQY